MLNLRRMGTGRKLILQLLNQGTLRKKASPAPKQVKHTVSKLIRAK